MTTLGHMEAFNPKEPENWETYIQRFQFFAEANDITDEKKKKAVFLSLVGSTTYELIKSLIAPEKIDVKSYKDITESLTRHFTPKTSETVCRFKFYRRDQLPDESIASYIAELRRLAETCNFGQVLEDMLRDRLICGIREEALQRRLLAEPDLKFNKAQTQAIAYETAVKQTSLLRECTNNQSMSAQVHKVNNERPVSSEKNKDRYKKKCFRCEGPHSPDSCRFKSVACNFCSKVGHIEKACITKKYSARKKQPKSNTHIQMETLNQESNTSEIQESHILKIELNKVNEHIIPVQLNNQQCLMEVDSGAAYSVIGTQTFENLWPDVQNRPALKPATVMLRDYQKKSIETKGMVQVNVQFRNKSCRLPLVITRLDGTSILGRNWFEPLGISLQGINQVSLDADIDMVIEEFKDIFSEGLGTYKGPPVSFELDPRIKPIICKARRLPFSMKPLVEAEIDKLIKEGVLEPTIHPKWATPIVAVMKPDNSSVRICGDYRVTLNRALKTDCYPVPFVADILSTLAGGKVFAKLDLRQAYLQLPVDDEAAEAQTIITHKGAFKVKRLQFGVSVAPQIFQRTMDTRLSGIEGVLAYYDDILVIGASKMELSLRIREVLKRFHEDGLKLRKEKCIFYTEKIDFLGYTITSKGIQPTKEKVKAILKAPAPKNKTELQAFLGLLNFYHIFLKDKATIAEPLHRLLHNNVPWQWTSLEENSFSKVKNLLTSEALLAHYDSKLPLCLTCDASQYGVGCVLSQCNAKGEEAPIAFHSRTMTSSERNFSQLDKEALAIIVGLKKWHNYIYGRHVTIRTDHLPLLGIWGNSKTTPQIMSPRMTRWTLMISAYRYELVYKPGKTISNADALSRLPVSIKEEELPPIGEVLMLENVPERSLTAKEVASETSKDPVLAKVLRWTLTGWPKGNPGEEFKPYWTRRTEISAYKNCLLWGNRIIIPPEERDDILKILHEVHPGIIKMKALARSYVWWPKMDQQIENLVASCTICQSNRHAPPANPTHPWEWARAPWTRLHIDHAGPAQGQYFLIVVDAFSKWLEVRRVSSTASEVTIKVLRELFATHGIPEVIVSDNATSFTSAEFAMFLKRNNIRHARIAPYHPSSNGQAERMVQTTKESLKKLVDGDWEVKLARFLLAQHVTPHSTTGISPAEALMKRRLHTALDCVHPDLIKDMTEKQEKSHVPKKFRSFSEEDPVFARNYATGPTWIPAHIEDKTGPLSYTVRTPQGETLKRHSDQLRNRVESEMATPAKVRTELTEVNRDSQIIENAPTTSTTTIDEEGVQVTPRPIRNRKKPQYLQDYEV